MLGRRLSILWCSIMRFNHYFQLLVGICLVLSSTLSQAALQLSATRLVVGEGEREASLVARNRGESDILIQSWLSRPGSDSPPPFAISPALAKLAGGKQQLLRIFSQGNELPADRESLFRLNVQEIPQQAEGNHLQLAVMQSIKLFYRPKGLPASANVAPKELQLSLNGQQLQLSNPTPYHINLTKLAQGEKTWPIEMLAPFSEASVAAAGLDESQPLTLQVINDYGAEKRWRFARAGAEPWRFAQVE